MRSRLFLLFMGLALCFLSLAHGQKPTPALKPPTPPPAAATPAAPAEPTELERTKLENIQLRMALLQQEELSLPQRRQELQQQYGMIVQQIEREHPGYVWNPQAGGLVAVPVAKPAEKKPAPEAKK